MFLILRPKVRSRQATEVSIRIPKLNRPVAVSRYYDEIRIWCLPKLLIRSRAAICASDKSMLDTGGGGALRLLRQKARQPGAAVPCVYSLLSRLPLLHEHALNRSSSLGGLVPLSFLFPLLHLLLPSFAGFFEILIPLGRLVPHLGG
jgi:hypothetical protein